jgi:hypothetical protein
MSDPVGVKSAHTSTTTTTLFTGPFYLKGLTCLGTATAGTLAFRDGGSGGTLLLEIDVPGNANNIQETMIPDAGILFETNCYLTQPTGYNTTIFYGK